MRTGVVVLTTPKRPQYLDGTIARLDAAGADLANVKMIVSDGWQRDFIRRPASWVLSIASMESRGCRAAMWTLFEAALEAKIDKLVYCEDDVWPASRAIERILETPIDDDQALISFFDSKEFPGARAHAKPGIYNVPVMGQDGMGLFGACCLLIPRRSMEWAIRVEPGERGMPEGADQALSWALSNSPWTVRGVSVPSLVEHVGDDSSMGHRRGQRAAWFEGP